MSDVTTPNGSGTELNDVEEKICIRDIFKRDQIRHTVLKTEPGLTNVHCRILSDFI